MATARHPVPVAPARKKTRVSRLQNDCTICLGTHIVWTAKCCQVQICQTCLRHYVGSNTNGDVTTIMCPGYNCDANHAPADVKDAFDYLHNALLRLRYLSVPDLHWLTLLILDVDGDSSSPCNPDQCDTCLDDTLVWTRPCCKVKICQDCIETYVNRKIDDGVIDIQCPGHDCDIRLSEGIITGAADATRAKRFAFLCVKSGRYKYKKACPLCDNVLTLDDAYLKFFDKMESIVVCPNIKCGKEWCFQCMVTWHEGYTCGEYKSFKTDTGVDKWAEKLQNTLSERNAQQCPSCKIWIQKIDGCYMMACKECQTNFCYTCGVKTPHPTTSTCVHSRTGVHGQVQAAARPAARPARPAAPARPVDRLAQVPIDQFNLERFDVEQQWQAGRGQWNGLSTKLVARFTTRACSTMWFRYSIVFVFAFMCFIGILAHGMLEAYVRPLDD